MPYPRTIFRAAGLAFVGNPPTLEENYNELTKLQLRIWRAHFGVCPRASLKMWRLLLQEFGNIGPTKGLELPAFFMTLFFLKTYPTVDVLASRVQKDPKTARKWVWFYINKMSDLTHILVSSNIFILSIFEYYYLYFFLPFNPPLQIWGIQQGLLGQSSAWQS